MAESGQKDVEGLREITECPICMSTFTDPRILPCIHTFCVECLKHTPEAAQKKPGDKMPCPLCGKEFVIPVDGVGGTQKNFFIDNLLRIKTAQQLGSSTIVCDMCYIRNDGKTGQKATMRCLECQDSYCDNCVKVHQFQKVTKDHQIVRIIGTALKSETPRLVSMKSCTKHMHEPLNYYCIDCKKNVCASRFVESHEFHDCNDVATVGEEFRQRIKTKAQNISTYKYKMLLMRYNNEKRIDALTEIMEKQKEIHERNQELKDMVDRYTKSLLEMETEMREIDRCCTKFSSFEAYCRELTLKGSAGDICSSVEQIILRANEFERDHDALNNRPLNSFKVSFHAADLLDNLQNAKSNFVRNTEAKTEITSHYEDFTFAVGLDDFTTITKDVVKLNLHQPYEISIQGEIPTTMQREAVAAVYDNTMYVAGIGHNADEIWKCNITSGWMECASLVQGRRRHSAAFIDEVLYICGGFVDSTELVLDSVEAFNAVTNKCTAVGKLIYAVKSSGNCVPFRRSLYIFGGSDEDDRVVSHVQVYSTKENTCTLISKPMPRPYYLMRAVLWGTSVILLGQLTCFVFHIESESWEEREQFKTNITQFGLVLENERILVIGGGRWENDADGFGKYKCRDHVRFVPIKNIIDDIPIVWKIHGKLPKPSLVYACATMRCNVNPTPEYEGGHWMREQSASFYS